MSDGRSFIFVSNVAASISVFSGTVTQLSNYKCLLQSEKQALLSEKCAPVSFIMPLVDFKSFRNIPASLWKLVISAFVTEHVFCDLHVKDEESHFHISTGLPELLLPAHLP